MDGWVKDDWRGQMDSWAEGRAGEGRRSGRKQAVQVTGSWMGGATDRRLSKCEYGWSCGWRETDGWMTDRQMGDGQMDG